MENQFLIDSEYLSAEALEKKHRLETDPSFKKKSYGIYARNGTDYIRCYGKSHESDELL